MPVIDTEHCTVMWDSATLRWSPSEQLPEQSYILEYCRQYELEGEGLRWEHFGLLFIPLVIRDIIQPSQQCRTLTGRSQASEAASRRFCCSQMKTTCSTSKPWTRLEQANRAKPLSFPPKVTNPTPVFVPFLCKDHFSLIRRPLLIHFRDKVPAAQRLGSPCSGAVSGSDHPALLLRRAWERRTCRRRVSFSLLSLPFRPQPYLNLTMYPGVPPSWVSCCCREGVTTGRPLFRGAQLTGSGWRTAPPAEAVH